MRLLKETLLGIAIMGLFTGESTASKQKRPNDLNLETSFSKRPSSPNNSRSKIKKENTPPSYISLQASQRGKRKGRVSVDVTVEQKKPRLCQEALLREQLQNLQQRVQGIHDEPEHWERICKVYQAFEGLNYSQEIWATIAKSLEENDPSFCHSSYQTSKEAVGGHLFYPIFINNWIEYEPTEHLLERFDILWSFAAGAKLKDARCQYYLGRTLDYIWINGLYDKEYEKEKPTYIRELFKQAFLSLPKNQGNADACYIIGRTYYKDPHPFFGTPLLQYNREKATHWFEKGQNSKSKLEALKVRRGSREEPMPTLEDYMALGREGYELAFIEAAQTVDTPEEKLAILEKGKEMSQGLVFLEMGYICEEIIKTRQEQKKKIEPNLIVRLRECYLKAGESGVAQGYIGLGKSYVDDPFSSCRDCKIKLETIQPEDINEAIKAFTKAGELQDYQGWEYLAKLYSNLADMKEKTKNSLKEEKSLKETVRKNRLKRHGKKAKEYLIKSTEAAHKASALGSFKYRDTITARLELTVEEDLLTVQDDLFIKKFGAIGALIKNIEKFLNL